WIGLDMTRSGTARLRILVNTDAGQSIQLSVSDADVQELLPRASSKKRRSFGWLLPITTAVLAAAAGWAASNLSAPKPRLLAAPEAAPAASAPRVITPPPVVKIPAESVPAPAQEIAVVMAAAVAPAMTAVVPPADVKPAEIKTVKPARTKAASPRRRS